MKLLGYKKTVIQSLSICTFGKQFSLKLRFSKENKVRIIERETMNLEALTSCLLLFPSIAFQYCNYAKNIKLESKLDLRAISHQV